MPALEEMSRDELIVLVRRQDAQIARQAAEMSALLERAETVEARLAKLEYLLSRTSTPAALCDHGLVGFRSCVDR